MFLNMFQFSEPFKHPECIIEFADRVMPVNPFTLSLQQNRGCGGQSLPPPCRRGCQLGGQGTRALLEALPRAGLWKRCDLSALLYTSLVL